MVFYSEGEVVSKEGEREKKLVKVRGVQSKEPNPMGATEKCEFSGNVEKA
jgi:hypothetical protein